MEQAVKSTQESTQDTRQQILAMGAEAHLAAKVFLAVVNRGPWPFSPEALSQGLSMLDESERRELVLRLSEATARLLSQVVGR